MEMKDFEVGKKYRLPSWNDMSYLLCVGITSQGVPVLETQDGSVYFATFWHSWQTFREYQEPREYWLAGNYPYPTKEDAEEFVRSSRLAPALRPEIIHVREVIK